MFHVKKIALMLALVGLLAACGQNRTINEVTYGTYGLLSPASSVNPNIEYRVVWSNLVLSFLFSETLIVPVLLIGYDLFEPVAAVPANRVPGQVR